jgi:amidase
VLNANEEGVDAFQWIRKLMDFCAFCAMFNGSGQPAMSVPLHWSADGLPVGVQFAGRFADEVTLFSIAGQLERARPWIERTPPISARRA